MIQEDSRYFALPEISVRDPQGVIRRSVAPRLRSYAQGGLRALHTIRQNDRLDALAQQYFQDSREWWRIADANPAFLSPRELLSDGVFHRCDIMLLAPQAWRRADLQRELAREAGVVKIVIFSATTRDARRFRLLVQYNRILFSETALVNRLTDDGCEILELRREERIGRSLRIPER